MIFDPMVCVAIAYGVYQVYLRKTLYKMNSCFKRKIISLHLYMKTEIFFWNGPPTHHIISCDIIMKLTGSKKERPLMYLVIKISNLLHFKQKSLCPKSKSWQRASRTKLKSIFKRAIFTSFSRLSEQSRIPTSLL